MARRAAVQLRVVHPTNPRIVVPVGDENRWIMGPTEGAWWRNYAWWVMPLGAVLLFGGWWMYFTKTTTPVARPPVAHISQPIPTPVAIPPVIINVPPTPPAPAPAAPAASGLPSTVTVETPGLERAVRSLTPPVPAPRDEFGRPQQADPDSAAERARRLEEWSRQP